MVDSLEKLQQKITTKWLPCGILRLLQPRFLLSFYQRCCMLLTNKHNNGWYFQQPEFCNGFLYSQLDFGRNTKFQCQQDFALLSVCRISVTASFTVNWTSEEKFELTSPLFYTHTACGVVSFCYMEFNKKQKRQQLLLLLLLLQLLQIVQRTITGSVICNLYTKFEYKLSAKKIRILGKTASVVEPRTIFESL